MTPRQMVAGMVLCAGIGVVGGASAAWAIYHRLGPASGPASTISPNSTRDSGTASGLNVDSIAAAGGPSVVKVITQPVSPASLAADPAGFASGVVVTADGLIVTSSHAVYRATELRIATSDGRAFQALLAATDLPHGIAILRAVQATDLHPLRFAAAAAHPGDAAVALGSPAFASLSVTSGTVNSTGRTVTTTGAEGQAGSATLLDAMTSDALPEAGADGGPVLDASANVIGIVSGGAHDGVPGMVAVNGRYAAALLDRVVKGAGAVHPTFGVQALWLDPATAAVTGLVPGALVRGVDPLGPSADRLRIGDVVTEVDGATVDDRHPLDPASFADDAGQPVTMTVSRGGRTVNVTVTVAPR